MQDKSRGSQVVQGRLPQFKIFPPGFLLWEYPLACSFKLVHHGGQDSLSIRLEDVRFGEYLLVSPDTVEYFKLSNLPYTRLDECVHERYVPFSHQGYLVPQCELDRGLKPETETPQMFKPARFCKLAKMTIITLEYVSPKTNTQTECLVGLPQGLPCSSGEFSVTSNEVESLTQIVDVQVEVSKSAILFGKSTHFPPHFFINSHPAHPLVIESMQCLIKLIGVT